jgi:hypothetical protein
LRVAFFFLWFFLFTAALIGSSSSIPPKKKKDQSKQPAVFDFVPSPFFTNKNQKCVFNFKNILA